MLADKRNKVVSQL